MMWLVLGFSWVFATEPTAFEKALTANQNLQTSERWVVVGGVEYREVEFRGEHYFVKFKDRGTATINCKLSNPEELPPKIEAGFTVFRRTQAFIELLRDQCKQKNGQDYVEVALDPRIGFTIPDNPHSTLKSRKIYILPNASFSGDF